jgi:hypothetical protein
MVVADLVWWWTGGHRSDNGPMDEREKEKGKSSGVFTKLPFFKYGNDNINQSCSIVVKTCCMNIISEKQYRENNTHIE